MTLSERVSAWLVVAGVIALAIFIGLGPARSQGVMTICVQAGPGPSCTPVTTTNPLPVAGSLTITGAISNASSGVATSSTNSPSVSYNYVFNGTTWDQMTSLTVGTKHAPTVAIVDASGNQITTFGSTITSPVGAGTSAAAVRTTTASDSPELALLSTINTNIQGAVPCLNATAFNTNSYTTGQTNPANCSLNGNLYVNVSNTPTVTATLAAGTANAGNVGGTSNVTPTSCGGTVTAGGTAQNAFTAQSTLRGMMIANIDTSEVMWISFTSTAAAADTQSYPLPPGAATTFAGFGSYSSQFGFGVNTALSVIAATTGHKFTCTRW